MNDELEARRHEEKMLLINNIAVGVAIWGISQIITDRISAIAVIVMIGIAAHRAPNGLVAHLLAAWTGIFHRIGGTHP